MDTAYGDFPGLAGKESACSAGDLGSIPGLGRSPGAGNGYPLQYCCLENSMDRLCFFKNCKILNLTVTYLYYKTYYNISNLVNFSIFSYELASEY